MTNLWRQAIPMPALLHDVGKIAIPDAILRKPRSLTEHADADATAPGRRRGDPRLDARARAPRAGRPRRARALGRRHGLTRDEIPIASRIVFVCDAYHAMTSDRPYRRASPPRMPAPSFASCRHAVLPRVRRPLLDVLTLTVSPV